MVDARKCFTKCSEDPKKLVNFRISLKQCTSCHLWLITKQISKIGKIIIRHTLITHKVLNYILKNYLTWSMALFSLKISFLKKKRQAREKTVPNMQKTFL